MTGLGCLAVAGVVAGILAAPFVAWGVNDVETVGGMVDVSVGMLYVDEDVSERRGWPVTEWRSRGVRSVTYRYEADSGSAKVELAYHAPLTGKTYAKVCQERVCLLDIDATGLVHNQPLVVLVIERDASGQVRANRVATFELRKRKKLSSRFLDTMMSV